MINIHDIRIEQKSRISIIQVEILWLYKFSRSLEGFEFFVNKVFPKFPLSSIIAWKTRRRKSRAGNCLLLFSSELASLSPTFPSSLDGKLSCDKGRSFRGGCEYLNENWFLWGNCGELWFIKYLVVIVTCFVANWFEINCKKSEKSEKSVKTRNLRSGIFLRISI